MVRPSVTFSLLCLVSVVYEAAGFRFEGSLWQKQTGPRRIGQNHPLRGSIDGVETPLRVQRSPSSSISVAHLPLNDSDPYGFISYAGSVVFVLIYDVDSEEPSVPTRTRLYRGTVYGKQIVNITGDLDPFDPNPLLSLNYYVSDEDYNIVAFPHAVLGQMYLSHDRGLTFETVYFSPPSITTSTLSWYPLDHEWVLGRDNLTNTLYASNDSGVTWTPVAHKVSDFTWGDPSIDAPRTVYYSVYDPVDSKSQLYSQQPPFSSQPRQAFDQNLMRFNRFVLEGHYIVVESIDTNGNHILYVSYKRKPFKLANFPSVHIHDFKVYDFNHTQALILLEDDNGQQNIYISDSTGLNYVLSLEDVVHDHYSSDLDIIYGVNGTFVANQYVRSSPNETYAHFRTVITFNNGGQWSPIKAPGVDSNGNTISCSFPTCSLHLFMDTSEYSALGVYSHSQSPGLVAAHGFYGQYEEQGSIPNLYMSKDGGLTWFQALPGSWGLAYLDHGGLIVAVPDYHQYPTRTLLYSTDEGVTWNAFAFFFKAVYVFGVIADPYEVAADVCFFGIEDRSYSWVVWNVDFQSVFPRECAESDYYTWNSGCRLGQQLNVQRKLTTASCLNGASYKLKSTITTCLCSSMDYQCAYGYKMPKYPTSPAGPCTRDTNVMTVNQTGPSQQKIPGDVCENFASARVDVGVAAGVTTVVLIATLLTAVLLVLGLYVLCTRTHRHTVTVDRSKATYKRSDGTVNITSDSFKVNSDTEKIIAS